MSAIPKTSSAPNVAGSLAGAGSLTQHDKLVKQSQKLVSQAFFGTLLKQMHDSPFKSEIFDGGRGGKAFSSLLDQHLADRMASGAGNKLVNAMVNRIEKNTGVKKQPKTIKKSALQIRFERGGYRKPQSTEERPNVPADFRA